MDGSSQCHVWENGNQALWQKMVAEEKLFASCHVDPSGALKFIKQDMDKVMEH